MSAKFLEKILVVDIQVVVGSQTQLDVLVELWTDFARNQGVSQLIAQANVIIFLAS